MNQKNPELGKMILGMRSAYERGENAMAYARRNFAQSSNTPTTTLIAYDLQSGTYVEGAIKNPEYRNQWCGQLADLISPHFDEGDTLLEVGCGEATTLAGVILALKKSPSHAYGFDISWSRCAHGLKWLSEKKVNSTLFVGDLFTIPLADSSIDVVYTAHSLEPNGGREKDAIMELLRVARKAVVLVEPAYELAGEEAQDRMRSHGYVRGLKETAMNLDCELVDNRLLPIYANPLNPSGALILRKKLFSPVVSEIKSPWQCPVTKTSLTASDQGYYSTESSLVYPVLKNIPLLRAEHAVVASSFFNLADDQDIQE